MVRISALSDDLLLKILSFLPTKVAISTSILSKQWQFLWMWLPKLEYDDYEIICPLSSWLRYDEFIDKNLPLHRAPVIESLVLRFCHGCLSQPKKIKRWVGIAVSRFVRELSIGYFCSNRKPHDVLSLPSSLYTCNSLMTLKLEGETILVDVPRIVCLPSLKTLKLQRVTYSNEDSLGLLLSHCPVLEDLLIQRHDEGDNVRALVVNVPSLQRLSLRIGIECSSSDEYVIVTPCLKYFKIEDYRGFPSYLIEPMPILEEAYIEVLRTMEKILESVTSVRRLSLESVSRFSLGPKEWYLTCKEYEPVDLKNKESTVPECLLRSLETFEFSSYMQTQEEIDFLSFFFKHASCLKSTPITDYVP
ncbi:unnamed protein product [Microthlaspi erraticum]|uniref:F-box domain-containing protein n=1 Tax=Microthlaspi erraticum TaxID=1685480 RepID=A0A6D2K739_9BRAS|nr:unnamed protein product [Microthlaspi erraticum]